MVSMRDTVKTREKRKVERFDLHIETILKVQEEAIGDRTRELITRDISSSGVYLPSNKPLPVGTRVDMDFLLNRQTLSNKSKGKVVNIITRGSVVRKDKQGFAVQFDKLFLQKHQA